MSDAANGLALSLSEVDQEVKDRQNLLERTEVLRQADEHQTEQASAAARPASAPPGAQAVNRSLMHDVISGRRSSRANSEPATPRVLSR